MDDFADYLDTLPAAERAALSAVIATVREHVPEAEAGLSYGIPAFRFRGQPLLGFASNKSGLSIYPFDPKIITALFAELGNQELGKGVVRFTVDAPIPERVIILMLELRLAHLTR